VAEVLAYDSEVGACGDEWRGAGVPEIVHPKAFLIQLGRRRVPHPAAEVG
jgi:hypothetical protein